MPRYICERCGCSSYLIVDGQEMTEDELLHLRYAPKSIKRRMVHMIWCDSDDHKAMLHA